MVSSGRELTDVEQAGGAGRAFDLSRRCALPRLRQHPGRPPEPHPGRAPPVVRRPPGVRPPDGYAPEAHLVRLLAASARRSADAAAVLDRALALREAIYRLFLALAVGDLVPREDLVTLERALGEALAQARIAEAHADEADGADHRPNVRADDDSVREIGRSVRLDLGRRAPQPRDAALARRMVGGRAADLLGTARRLVCASETCAWLFLDTSRNGSRRWCSMRTCGSRQGHDTHARVRAAGGTTTAAPPAPAAPRPPSADPRGSVAGLGCSRAIRSLPLSVATDHDSFT